MNKTKIDWCTNPDGSPGFTWNPITGCLFKCGYCYANKIATRFSNWGFTTENRPTQNANEVMKGLLHELTEKYVNADGKTEPFPFKFEPTFHGYRLAEPQRIKKPSTIFVCSMADMFGPWVQDDWIKKVFEACAMAPQHTYIFLTKNPSRYGSLDLKEMLPLKPNHWYGSTQTTKADYRFVSFKKDKHQYNTFVSIEPIQEDFTNNPHGDFNLMKWVIVGGETGNRRDKIMPQKSWIDEIAKQCQQNHVPIFMKDSLSGIMGTDMKKEYPWTVERGACE